MLGLIYLVLFLSLSSAQRVDFDGTLNSKSYFYNNPAFPPGIYRTEINLEIINGKAKILMLSEYDFSQFRNNQSFIPYTVISDQPFSSLHFTTELENFPVNFYFLIRSTNLVENIQVRGYVVLIGPTFAESHDMKVLYIILAVTLFLSVIGIVVIYKSFGCFRYLLRKKCETNPGVVEYIILEESGVIPKF